MPSTNNRNNNNTATQHLLVEALPMEDEEEQRAQVLLGDDETNRNHPTIESVSNKKKRTSSKKKKKRSSDKNKTRTPYALTTVRPTTDNPRPTTTFWGRFDHPNGLVLSSSSSTTNRATEETSLLPVATARMDDRHVRLAFLRKVYLILAAQMVVTFAVCAVMAWNKTIRVFCVGSGWPLYYVNLVVSLGTIGALHFYKRSYPLNVGLLSLFTLSTSYTVGIVTAMYAQGGAGELVMEAVFISATVFIALTIFTLQSKWDFSFLGAGLGMGLWILILWGLFAIIFGVQTGYVYALGGSVLFSLYIIYDTYMICERLDPEDYIVAAIELYLDLVNLLLYILRVLAEVE